MHKFYIEMCVSSNQKNYFRKPNSSSLNSEENYIKRYSKKTIS